MNVKAKQKEAIKLNFKATPYQLGRWVILRLPEKESEKLPSRGQVMVKGTINGYTLEKVLEPDGRWGHWFKVDKQMQKVAGVKVGSEATLEISPSKDWPEPHIPEDFSKALASAPKTVQELWKKITPMARWEWLRWVNATSINETRAHRIEASISKMQSGKRRPCCFNLAACTDPDLARSGRLAEPENVKEYKNAKESR